MGVAPVEHTAPWRSIDGDRYGTPEHTSRDSGDLAPHLLFCPRLLFCWFSGIIQGSGVASETLSPYTRSTSTWAVKTTYRLRRERVGAAQRPESPGTWWKPDTENPLNILPEPPTERQSTA